MKFRGIGPYSWSTNPTVNNRENIPPRRMVIDENLLVLNSRPARTKSVMALNPKYRIAKITTLTWAISATNRKRVCAPNFFISFEIEIMSKLTKIAIDPNINPKAMVAPSGPEPKSLM